ncbi:MAG: hypothetical protein ABIQ73_02420 [Acidimicrobiales bacterium]
MTTQLIAVWIATGLGGWLIGVTRGRPVWGFVIGFGLGFIGMIIMLVLPSKTPKTQKLMMEDRRPPLDAVRMSASIARALLWAEKDLNLRRR